MKNKMLKVKAIAVDVDGTLTQENGSILLEAIEALRKIKKKLDIRIVLASGNAYPVLMGLARYIGNVDLVIAENGGVIGLRNEVKIIGNPEIGLKARNIIKEKLGYMLYESWQNNFRLVDFAFKLRRGYKWEEAVEKAEKIIKTSVPGAISVFSGVAIHVKDKDVNKGSGLKVAAEMLNIKTENFMAIGDSDVDVEMLKKAGIGVAVANASPKAISHADITTKQCGGRGFIEIIDELLKLKQNI